MSEIETVAITGGTGSFGSALAAFLFSTTPHHVRVISRDEHRQETMQRLLPPHERLTYILCDIRNPDRLAQAFYGADIVIHAAALKTVGAGERQADEVVGVNIDGTRNVINCAIAAGVSRSLLISSDKAVDPINFYGTTKRVAEGLFVQANQIGGPRGLRLAAVRGGNVWASRGSVVEHWRNLPPERMLLVSDPASTRFHLHMNRWVRFAWRAVLEMHGGEIIVPVCAAWNLGDLADAFGRPYSVGGLRGGDKLHEYLISRTEARRAVSIWAYDAYAIEPLPELCAVMRYEPWQALGGGPPDGYSSDVTRRLTVAELRHMIGRD